MLSYFLTSGGEQGNSCNNNQMFIPMLIVVAVLLVVVLFVMPMINGKRQKKNVEDLRSSLSVGDTIETVGGIIGVIKAIREPVPGRKELVIETGNTSIVVDIQALYTVISHANVPSLPVDETVEEPFAETADITEQTEVQSEVRSDSESVSVEENVTETDNASPAIEPASVDEEAATVATDDAEAEAVVSDKPEAPAEDKPAAKKPRARKSGSGKKK